MTVRGKQGEPLPKQPRQGAGDGKGVPGVAPHPAPRAEAKHRAPKGKDVAVPRLAPDTAEPILPEQAALVPLDYVPGGEAPALPQALLFDEVPSEAGSEAAEAPPEPELALTAPGPAPDDAAPPPPRDDTAPELGELPVERGERDAPVATVAVDPAPLRAPRESRWLRVEDEGSGAASRSPVVLRDLRVREGVASLVDTERLDWGSFQSTDLTLGQAVAQQVYPAGPRAVPRAGQEFRIVLANGQIVLPGMKEIDVEDGSALAFQVARAGDDQTVGHVVLEPPPPEDPLDPRSPYRVEVGLFTVSPDGSLQIFQLTNGLVSSVRTLRGPDFSSGEKPDA